MDPDKLPSGTGAKPKTVKPSKIPNTKSKDSVRILRTNTTGPSKLPVKPSSSSNSKYNAKRKLSSPEQHKINNKKPVLELALLDPQDNNTSFEGHESNPDGVISDMEVIPSSVSASSVVGAGSLSSVSRENSSISSVISVLLSSSSPLPTSKDKEDNHISNANKKPASARIDLNDPENLQNIPTNTRQVIMTSLDSSKTLTKINPYRMGQELKTICGDLHNVEYQRSGNILITTSTLDQVVKLLEVTCLMESKIPIKISVAWGKQLTYGTLYAPEFQHDTLEYLLTILKPHSVVGIRKLFSDPKKNHVPLYVLTFLAKACPDKVKVGYSIYSIDKYYPNPLRCGKCCRWGHTATVCKDSLICSFCSAKGHSRDNCPSTIPRCTNCKGAHDALTKTCPIYLQEVRACHLTADLGISFVDARIRVCSGTEDNPVNKQTLASDNSHPASTPSLASETAFPSLSQLHNSQTLSHQAQSSHPPRPVTILSQSPNAISQAPPTINVNDNNSIPNASSQESVWFTPGQKRRSKVIASNLSNAEPISLDLDSPSQVSLSLNNNHSQPTSSNLPHHTENPDLSLSFAQLLQKLLPILMRLVFAPDVTTKIEIFLNLGQLLHANAIVSEMLVQLGLSSLSHSQRK